MLAIFYKGSPWLLLAYGEMIRSSKLRACQKGYGLIVICSALNGLHEIHMKALDALLI